MIIDRCERWLLFRLISALAGFANYIGYDLTITFERLPAEDFGWPEREIRGSSDAD